MRENRLVGPTPSQGKRNWIGWLLASPSAVWASYSLFKASRTEGDLLRQFLSTALNGALLSAGVLLAWYALADLLRRVALRQVPRLRTVRGILAGILIGVALRGLFTPATGSAVGPATAVAVPPSALPSSSPPSTPLPTATATATLTSTSPPTSTQAPTLSPTPEQPPVNGTCDRATPPCLYFNALSWPEVAAFLFSTSERCRWPEIADLNREPSGQYLLPLAEKAMLYVPAAAPARTYPSMIRVSNGTYAYVLSCSLSQTKPCLYTVPNGLYGSTESTYSSIAAVAYGRSEPIDVQRIMGANLASDCSGSSIYVAPGIKLVIPK